MTRRLCSLVLFIALSAIDASSFTDGAAVSWNGAVVGVLDGDTIDVLHNRHAERIRLVGIDCPEKGQAFGKRAKQATSDLAFNQVVTVLPIGKDRYDRTIATVTLPDGKNLNHELVRDGWCWWYRKYAPTDADLQQLEQDARDKRIGLWIDPAPTPPWVYRKAMRE